MSNELESQEASTAANSVLRKVAILISSVDADAARHLIEHLTPTQRRAVRGMSSELAQVTAEEQRRVLQEFEQESLPHCENPRFDSQAQHPNRFAWQDLTVDAIYRAMRQERPLIVAVVVSQLPTDRAVAVLSRMGAPFSTEVVGQLAQLSQMDASLMQEIDEYLSVKLGEHQHQLESEAENFKKIQSLIGAAPQQLQREWTNASRSAMARSTLQMQPGGFEGQVSDSSKAYEQYCEPESSKRRGSAVSIRPIQSSESPRPMNASSDQPESVPNGSDATLIEFESLLSLPAHVLVNLFESTEQETLLLAIAGASPAFVNRLRDMLGKDDFEQLDARVKQIGAIRIRDIDQAQVRLVQQARQLLKQQFDERELSARKAS